MNSENKTCQNCKTDFTIEPEDFQFYEKIKVPPPTWCPKCRAQRRMIWRNERALYKRKSDLSGEEIVSQFPASVPFPVYSVQEFFARGWETPSLDYDPEKSFLEQVHALRLKTPQCALLTDLQSEENGSLYQNSASRNKNCYLVSASGDNEDCMYANNLDYSQNAIDALWSRYVSYSYDCAGCLSSSNIFFSTLCRNCEDGWFLYDCKNCSHCFGCVGLKNKSYCWMNEQLSKKEYEERFSVMLKELTPTRIEEYKDYLKSAKLKFPRKFSHSDAQSLATSTGDYLLDSHNVKQGFTIFYCENSKYVMKLIHGKECYDVNDWGDPAELCYESITIGKGAYKVFFSNNCWPECRELQYCDSCANCQHCFGCVSLKDKKYCILNKQYGEAEYHALVSRIVEDMKQRGEYGEFFPPTHAPFAYNETIAQEQFHLTETEAIAGGYRWSEPEERNYRVTLPAKDVPEHIMDVPDNITKDILGCDHLGQCDDGCTSAFRVIPDELQFYKHFGIPIPRMCFNCRHAVRMRERNPWLLWHRACQCAGKASQSGVYENMIVHQHGENACPVEFETTYAPERPEIVYCEACYNAEVA